MRKVSLIFFLVLFILTIQHHGKATCPTGWNSASFTKGGSTCGYTVHYCWIADPAQNHSYLVRLDGVEFNCCSACGNNNPCMSDFFFHLLKWDIANDLAINQGQTFTPCGPPTNGYPYSCLQDNYTVTYQSTYCFKLVRTAPCVVQLQYCLNKPVTCTTIQAYCWSNTYNQILECGSQYVSGGTTDCPSVPSQGLSPGPNVGDETDCYFNCIQ